MQVPSASSSPIHLLASRQPQTLDRPQARPGASATHRTRPASESFPSFVKIRDGTEASEKRSPLQKLLADWGKKGSHYDLNGNGKVDVPDLQMMLARMKPGGSVDNPPSVQKLPPAVDPERPVEPEKPMSPLEQLRADWGKKDSVYDLNGNGTVDVPDLLMMLARMKPGGSNDTPPPVEKPPPTVNPERPPVEPEKPMSPLEQLLADWGRKGSDYDLNGNGRVDVPDLLMMLGQLSKDDDTPPSKSTLKQLLADWGKKDSDYDLNGNGRVDIPDLLMMLGQLSKDDDTPPSKSTLKQLLADWGKKGSEYDLNGNGTVDVPDLLKMLGQLSKDDDTPPSKSPLEQLLADWGKKGSDSDLNGNGTVDVPDLLMMLRQMASGGSRHRQPISEADAGSAHRSNRGHGSHRGHRSHAPHMMHGRAAAEHIARTLMNRTDTSEPSRLRETVERSSLADQQKRLILDRITAMAPRGRMVSVVA